MTLTKSTCLNCIINDLWEALLLLNLSENKNFLILKEVLKFLNNEFSNTKTPSYYITGVHRILKNIANISVPFSKIRENCNKIGVEISEKLKKEIKNLDSKEKIKLLIKWVIAGNHLDFRTVGTGYNFDVSTIEAMLKKWVNKGLTISQTNEIIDSIMKSKQILYIHDNVGEIAFDKLLIEELKKYASITSVLRGGAITSDATVYDAEMVGLKETSNRIINTGTDTLGILYEEISEELKIAISESDLIIIKGQANYYTFSEPVIKRRGIVSLFSTKCHVVANEFNLKDRINNIAAILK